MLRKKGLVKNGTYVGDIFIGSGQNVNSGQANGNSKGCLIGAKSYEKLLAVTVGKYLVDPIILIFVETSPYGLVHYIKWICVDVKLLLIIHRGLYLIHRRIHSIIL